MEKNLILFGKKLKKILLCPLCPLHFFFNFYSNRKISSHLSTELAFLNINVCAIVTKKQLPIFTKTMAFTLECSFCGIAGRLSWCLRTSTPACRPPPARLGDSETRRTAHPGSWHTLYSLQSPGRMQTREAGDVYGSLEERRRLCKLSDRNNSSMAIVKVQVFWNNILRSLSCWWVEKVIIFINSAALF